MKLSLRDRIAGFGLTVAFIPAVILGLLFVKEQKVISNHLNEELRSIAENQFELVLRHLNTLTTTTDSLLLNQVKSGLNVSRKVLSDHGGFHIQDNETVEWQASNQFTGVTKSVQIPGLKLGDNKIERNVSFDVELPVIDDVFNLIGGTITIFQRVSPEGDMLRVATNVRRLDGTRAVGTYIPAINPDGQPNEVIRTILAGETYIGPAFVVNEWYLSGYEPIKNDKGEIVGVLYFGYPMDSIGSLQKAVEEITIGENGYIWITQGKQAAGNRRLLFTGKQPEDGATLPAGFPGDLNEVVRKTISLGEHTTFIEHIPGSNGQNGRYIASAYFPEWDWVLGLTAYEADFKDAQIRVQSVLDGLLRNMIVGCVVALIIALLLALILGKSLASPIANTAQVARRVAGGDLRMDDEVKDLKENKTGTVEISTLREAIFAMVSQLRSLLTKVRKASIQVVSSSTQIRSAVRQQESSIQNFGASTSEIAAAVREINATSLELVRTMNDVQSSAAETAQRAESGRTRLQELDHIMSTLDSSSASASERLSVIKAKAETISKVVTTITKVADQTNLLSLNAAIEAEKAGEFGQGFSVVAREIRRLADQTAVATLDIEKMVREMQSSVESGVNEMGRFSEEVHRGVEHTSRINAQFSEIIEQVQQLTPRFEIVLEGMQAQNQGGNQINEAMVQLNQAAKETTSSLKEFAEAALALQQSVDDLKSEISNFKVE